MTIKLDSNDDIKNFENALINKEPYIILEGTKAAEIVKRLEEVQNKKRTTRNTTIGIGILCLIAAPFTAGGSLIGLGATAGAVALSEGVILAIIGALVSLSVAAIHAIKEYRIKKLEYNRIELTRIS